MIEPTHLEGFWIFEPGSYSYDALSPEAKQVVDFLTKRDYEGGTIGLLKHSGDYWFPEHLQELARQLEDLEEKMESEIRSWANSHGIDT